jgi:signal transduction histidine kinase
MAIPVAGFGRAPARSREIACQLRGDPTCEWEFTWSGDAGRRRAISGGLLGIVMSLAVLAYLVARAPGWELVAIIGATLLPAGLILYGDDARRRARELREQQELLVEQRDVAQQEHERSEQARGALQRSNLELQQRLAELMTINDLSVALSTTLDLEELVERSLRAVVTHLRFDRALILLVDEARGVLAGGRSVGGMPEMEALVASIELPVDHPESQLARLFRSDGPMLFRDVDQDAYEPNRALAAALGVTAFLGTPLTSQGRTVGVLAVDNRLSGREVESGDGPLLYTVGNLVAGAIETARLYAEIERQNRALEARVAERTSALARATEEAQEARAAAEAASDTKSAFLSNVSHELRTPLTSVVGFTRLIDKRLAATVFPAVASDDPKVARAMRQIGENLGIIVAEGERLTSLINDVLDLAKIEAGRFEWQRLPIRPAELVTRGAAAMSALFEARELALVTEVEPDLSPIVGDRDRLLQVVINLLSNAVKFTPSGSVTLTAGREDGALVVRVIDTGIGIAPEDQAKVFEAFAQAGDTLTDKPRGTGLGLPICRQIIEQHGGRIWLTSAPGAGSTFSFSLPIPTAIELAVVERRTGQRRASGTSDTSGTSGDSGASRERRSGRDRRAHRG